MTNISNNKLKTNNILFENDDTLFKKYLMKSHVFAEYGCGQSTYWALKNTTAQILSVDTSIDWIKTIKQSKHEKLVPIGPPHGPPYKKK